MRMNWIILLSFLFSPPWAMGAPMTGTVYEQGSNHSKALYEWKRLEDGPPTQRNVTSVYTAPDKKEAVIEKAVTKNNQVQKYSIQYFQTGEMGTMEVRGDKIFFEYTKDGKTKHDDEKLPENLIVTATLVDFVTDHAPALLQGDTINARMGVLDRLETVGFKFFKTEEAKRDGKDTVTIKMKPTSFIIAALVDPLLLTFQKEGMKLVEINGRTMPKRLSDGKWKDLDADTVYNVK